MEDMSFEDRIHALEAEIAEYRIMLQSIPSEDRKSLFELMTACRQTLNLLIQQQQHQQEQQQLQLQQEKQQEPGKVID